MHVCIYVEYVCFSGGYVVLCARASKEKWRVAVFFLCFDFGGGHWEGEGETSARSLRKERRKKIKTISLFSCLFPTVALPEPEGYPFARSFIRF